MTAEEQVRGTREEGQSVTDLIGNHPSQRRGVPTILAQQDIWRLLTSCSCQVGHHHTFYRLSIAFVFCFVSRITLALECACRRARYRTRLSDEHERKWLLLAVLMSA